ncbi:MAG: LpxL/LpxP family Kdo(2)-lipid IV(A) lauroyl/palmitoleoyl acyltransferase [Gammaproteobacteria bacterium]|nr:LpxL/LpxP family Kdo(2)-lipid IV(A) lauroyl/palmitoleoyl acyltransferase [Gammaproteobacteria bacterium]
MRLREKAPLFLAPRYWATWLLIGLMYVSAKLPLPVLYVMGSAIGEIVYWLIPRRRHIAQINIDLCFPELSKQERAKLVKDCFHSVGKSVMETSLAWWGNEKILQKRVQIEGLEYIEQAKKTNRPILLLSAHMCCTEIGSKLLSLYCPFQAMYKPAKNRLFDAVVVAQRSRIYEDVIPRKQSRRLLKNLKNGITTWYAPDQSFGSERTLFAPFFGVQAATLTATSRLVKFSNAIVIAFFPYRLPDNKGYRLVLKPPLENFPSDSVVEDAVRVNQIIEEAVRVAPEQYLWLHRRFHHRPEGEAQFY